MYNSVIQGADKTGVISAMTRIEVLVASARSRLSFTHFVSVPLCEHNFTERFEEFKHLILEDDNKVSLTNHVVIEMHSCVCL